MASIIRFMNNLRYLFRYNLKSIARSTEHLDRDFDDVHYAIEHIKFEIEDDIKHMQHFTILDDHTTINHLRNSEYSLCRFGDGEFNLIAGNDIPFQKASSRIAERLSSVLSSTHSNIILAIPNLFASYMGGGATPTAEGLHGHSMVNIMRI